MYSTMTRSSFSTTAFAQLVHRLRHTNARYDQITSQFRCRIRPTHHAKRRAYWAGLRIDISKARACPGTLVSRRPLPIVDTAYYTPLVVAPLPFMSNYNHMNAFEGSALGLQLTNLPEVVVPSPPRSLSARAGQRRRLTIRVPPLHYQYSASEMNAPGAPLLRPRQLPEDDSEIEDISLGHPSSSCGYRSFGWSGLATYRVS
ncbi:hypothetical protein PAXRUDRAFT_432069 [Paxillus rubicundulus Ve08.2h10]|uniref:Uncharacterized protein n=1 Tax=Paxillus rubicundulus Ve08.2h10 TaxID=930991 RepID=A0A0D0DQI2_9AGAM|nr:hypothetical protein PAXRUDRAFT_432069 [Paxillus rubicundulus Ve08.2h10]